jgi:stearoyl-CoA desaturase (delta-9 desaturase)
MSTVEAASAHKPAARMLRASVRRLQWSIAFGVVVIPFLGVVAASVIFRNRGIGWVELGSLLVMYAVCMLGITVGFHRHFAHRSFNTSPGMRLILGACGSMAAQGPLLFWVSTHRRHHAFSDKPGDPHSPNLHGEGLWGMIAGLWHSHIGWMFTVEQTDLVEFARDVLQDPAMFMIHRTYLWWVLAGLALPAALGGLLTMSWMGALLGFVWGGLVRMFLVNHAAWCVGSISHVFGSRPFKTGDHSANNYMVAVLAFGEGLQNNHHAFSGSFSHAVRWWQPDLSATVIRLLKSAGLVWDLKSPSERAIRDSRRLA